MRPLNPPSSDALLLGRRAGNRLSPRRGQPTAMVCDNANRTLREMILDELQREFELTRARAHVVRGYL